MVARLKICEFVEWELQKYRQLCNFTDTELEYFNLKAKGKTNIEMAHTMNVSENTIKAIVSKPQNQPLMFTLMFFFSSIVDTSFKFFIL